MRKLANPNTKLVQMYELSGKGLSAADSIQKTALTTAEAGGEHRALAEKLKMDILEAKI